MSIASVTKAQGKKTMALQQKESRNIMIDNTNNIAPIREWPKKDTLDVDNLRGEVGRLDGDEHCFLETLDSEDREKGYAFNEVRLWGEMTATCLRRIEEVLVEDEEEGVPKLDAIKSEARKWLDYLKKLSEETAARI